MVVGLDLERDAPAIVDVNDAGVLLADFREEPRTLGRKELQQRAAVLVAAVLAPERAEEAQLNLVGLAAELLDDELVLVAAEGDRVEDGLFDGHLISA